MNKITFLLKASMVAVAALFSQSVFAQQAGTVTFVLGDVKITHADKTVVAAAKNIALNEGDTVETNHGRAQLMFADGGKVSLQPNTVYKINKFSFASGKEDGSEYNFAELVKGGLRTVSGLIGHKNRDHYQLKTAVATIGIRGTEYTAFYDNALTMTTNQGSVDVCALTGDCLNALAGQTILVTAGSAPIYTNKQIDISAASPKNSSTTTPESNKAVYTASEEIGEKINLDATTPPDVTPEPVSAPNGAAAAGSMTVYAGTTNSGFNAYTKGTVDLIKNPFNNGTNNVTFNAQGDVTNLADTSSYSVTTSCTPTEKGQDTLGLGIFWSLYTSGFTVTDASGSGQQGAFHTMYATRGTTNAELRNLQTLANGPNQSQITGTYSTVIGHTSPTDINGTTGVLNSLVIGVNFSNLTITQYDIDATVAEQNWVAGLSPVYIAAPSSASIANFSSTNGLQLTARSSLQSSLITGAASGAFVGPQAQAVITSYRLQNALAGTSIAGTAALIKTADLLK